MRHIGCQNGNGRAACPSCYYRRKPLLLRCTGFAGYWPIERHEFACARTFLSVTHRISTFVLDTARNVSYYLVLPPVLEVRHR
jgi:hypothetical protein